MLYPPGQRARSVQLLDSQRFSVTSRREGATHEIRPCGELDRATAEALQEALERAERSDARAILLDLTGVTFMDSSGVQLVMNAEARSRSDGNRLSVRRGRPSVQRVFKICGVDALLPFVD